LPPASEALAAFDVLEGRQVTPATAATAANRPGAHHWCGKHCLASGDQQSLISPRLSHASLDLYRILENPVVGASEQLPDPSVIFNHQ
jgi:hypothetical protein